MEFNTLIALWSISILFVITPGADWGYAISAGIKEKVLPAIFGLLLGHFIATLIVAAGVGTLIARQPIALMVLTIIGSLYLLWIGINLSLHPATIASENDFNIDAKQAWWFWVLKGFGVSGLNPKVFLLFLALLPQFIHSSASWSITTQIIFLGLIHVLSCAVVYLFVGFGAQILLKTRPRAAKTISRISGGLMVLIAIILLIDQVKNYHF